MVQWPRALALAEDPGLISGTHRPTAVQSTRRVMHKVHRDSCKQNNLIHEIKYINLKLRKKKSVEERLGRRVNTVGIKHVGTQMCGPQG